MRRSRLARDPISRDVFGDERNNLQADQQLVKASQALEKNFVRKGDPV